MLLTIYSKLDRMGCSVGKFDARKIKDTTIISESDIRIQTVFKLNPSESKSRRNTKNSKECGKRKRSKSESKNRKSSDTRRKHSRSRTEKVTTAYDTRITAKYDIKAVIGKGTYSRVLRVEHRISKQPFALKTIDAPGGRDAFEAELTVLRRLNHPNVIKLIEVFESNHRVYMVMELATGGSLLDRLETKGFLPEEDSIGVMKMVLNGVKYLHALGITHRDLKPDNLLYYHPGKESKIMITDFSFASTRKPSGNPYMHTVCGTPQYVAPEIVARKPYTCAVDMWAVGVITFIVLCGAFPFDAEQDAQIFKLILRGKVVMTDPVWSDVSDISKSFVRHLLRPDPGHRPTADQASQHVWMTTTVRSPLSGSSRIGGPDQRSQRSLGCSSSSSSSRHSLRVSRRVQPQHLDALLRDPEITDMIRPFSSLRC